MFYNLKDAEIRNICRGKLESLEYWLRRLIDETLSVSYGDFFNYIDENGRRLIKKDIVDSLDERVQKEPSRYARKVDAIYLQDAINIICKPHLFKAHFRIPLNDAYPNGNIEARTFMNRLVDPRNRLSHANSISNRQAEQIICYSNDIIDSLKKYYNNQNMTNEYNVPLILKFLDSHGSTYFREQLYKRADGSVFLNLKDEPSTILRPGDVLTLEVDIDPTFDTSEYQVHWRDISGQKTIYGPKGVFHVTPKHVGSRVSFRCMVTTNKEWHRINFGTGAYADDDLEVVYKVLPPL